MRLVNSITIFSHSINEITSSVIEIIQLELNRFLAKVIISSEVVMRISKRFCGLFMIMSLSNLLNENKFPNGESMWKIIPILNFY